MYLVFFPPDDVNLQASSAHEPTGFPQHKPQTTNTHSFKKEIKSFGLENGGIKTKEQSR